MTNSKRIERRKLEAASWFSVVRAYQECTRRYAQMLRAFDLTIPQLDALSAVYDLRAQATPKAIANRLVVTRGNVTGLLKRLQEKQLLVTRDNELDGRSFVCELTAAGSELLSRARGAAAVFIKEQLSPFDDATLAETESLMNHMQRHLLTLDPDAIAAKRSRADRKLPEDHAQ